MTQKFLVVDDDFINNILSRFIIEKAFPGADIQTYTDPESALVYIKSTYANIDTADTVLFLDINMPSLTGWEFLDAFELFDAGIKEKLTVYMLSSSVNPQDKERAAANKNVSAYLEKPLTKERVESLAKKL